MSKNTHNKMLIGIDNGLTHMQKKATRQLSFINAGIASVHGADKFLNGYLTAILEIRKIIHEETDHSVRQM